MDGFITLYLLLGACYSQAQLDSLLNKARECENAGEYGYAYMAYKEAVDILKSDGKIEKALELVEPLKSLARKAEKTGDYYGYAYSCLAYEQALEILMSAAEGTDDFLEIANIVEDLLRAS